MTAIRKSLYIIFPEIRKIVFMNVPRVTLLSFPQKYSGKGEVILIVETRNTYRKT